MTTKLFRNARIVTPEDPGVPLRGADQGKVREIEGGALLCRHGLVEQVGPEEQVRQAAGSLEIHEEIDLGGRCVIPGFVDPHTHL